MSKEKTILNKLMEAWNLYVKEYGYQETPFDSDQINDFRKAIHDAQRIVICNNAKKVNPDIFK